jgi:hypothetical protein
VSKKALIFQYVLFKSQRSGVGIFALQKKCRNFKDEWFIQFVSVRKRLFSGSLICQAESIAHIAKAA